MHMLTRQKKLTIGELMRNGSTCQVECSDTSSQQNALPLDLSILSAVLLLLLRMMMRNATVSWNVSFGFVN